MYKELLCKGGYSDNSPKNRRSNEKRMCFPQLLDSIPEPSPEATASAEPERESNLGRRHRLPIGGAVCTLQGRGTA
jgi:hypothetical protein